MKDDSLGRRIKDARRSLDLSQSELGSLAGGMSQAWVSRVEQNRLSPDPRQLDALESVLGALSVKPRELAVEPVEPGRGPAAYRAARLATENKKRRAELAMRMERLQAKEHTSFVRLSEVREMAVAFVQEFMEQVVSLPDGVIAELETPDFGAFDPVEDETQSLIDARNGVIQQIGIQLDAAARTAKVDGASAGVALALGATAVESFAFAATGTAIGRISRVVSSTFGMHGGPYASRRLGGSGLTSVGGLGASYPFGTVAAPALLAAGVALTVAGPRLLSKAQDERSQLLQASLELDRLHVVLDEFSTQCEVASRLLTHAREFGSRELTRIQECVANETDLEIENLVKVAALILTLLPVPVPGEPSDSAPLGTTHRANELALDTAESWLVEVGALE